MKKLGGFDGADGIAQDYAGGAFRLAAAQDFASGAFAHDDDGGNEPLMQIGLVSVDASADPYAGTNAANGKPIWSAQQAADNLSRPDVDWSFNNYGALDDNTLTFSFWDNFQQIYDSYYYNEDHSYALSNDAIYAEMGKWAPFNEQQRDMARANIELWDDLIDVTFVEVDDPASSNIPMAFTNMSAAAGAHAYYPTGDVYDWFYEYYGWDQPAGQISGDVWANWQYQEDFTNQGPTDYGWFAITHELGHSLGLAHGGEYNASAGVTITYANSAYFFQDSQQYTIMSYFAGQETGARWVDWTAGDSSGHGYYVMPSTPMVHDIKAVQDIYGADPTTRAGNTVYGFNSTAGNVVYDFTQVQVPVLTIYDASGTDTLDLSGYTIGSVIDLNEGAFSSAGWGMTATAMAERGLTTQAQVDAYAAARGMGPGARPVDNIAIAYGTVIENAVGGSGNDRITGNAAANNLKGMGGDDTFVSGAGADTMEGGTGTDTVTYLNATSGIVLSMATTAGSTGDAAGDTFVSIEAIEGSNFADSLTGDSNANAFYAGVGNDTLEGAAGGDILHGGDGFDFASYGSSNAAVTVTLADGSGIGSGSGGHATGDQLLSIEGLAGSAYADTLNGNSADNVLRGSQGADTLNGGGGNDTASYSDSWFAVTVSLVNNSVSGGAAGDKLISIESLEGSAYNDTLTGSSGDNTLSGLAGNDTLDGGGGIDKLYGGDDNDTLDGGNQNDVLDGGAGTDILRGGNNSDWLNGGTGNDTLTGGNHNDTFAFSTNSGNDTITDFRRADGDKIDLMDVRTTGGASVDFTWVSGSAFSGAAGGTNAELIVYKTGSTWYLAGDVDGNGSADFTISTGTTQLISSDVTFA